MDDGSDAVRKEISPFGALTPALEHTRRMLFEPFDLARWFTLGFIIFLAQLTTGGGYSGNVPGKGRSEVDRVWGPQGPSDDLVQGVQWLIDHAAMLILAAVAIFLLINAVGIVLQYLHARGHFMFIECVARNKAEVKVPWRNARQPAWSYFLFRLALFFLLIWTTVLLLALPLWGILKSVAAREFVFPGSLFGLIPLLIILVPLGILSALLGLLVRDFVTPVMYLQGLDFLGALERTARLWKAHPGELLLYLVMRFVISLLTGLAAFLVACFTCCIGALPVIHQTITAPLHVFVRSWTLAILEGFGPEFTSVSSHGSTEAAP